ncbi:MAG: helix-turn-helix transcriptional regulator [Actinomycetia bacterium]|nr:helix-turn-helix transcriptional regulator [Actinomycetes bacterium]MCP4083819.1 helix-turn-helix transcriptional regulator [Actinomycetes bacterium]
MDAATTLTHARASAGLSLRELAGRAGTSHATLSAYEQGRVVPAVDTVNRIVRAAGFSLDAELHRRHRTEDGLERGEELAAVLELAEEFPARHSPRLDYPVFPGR